MWKYVCVLLIFSSGSLQLRSENKEIKHLSTLQRLIESSIGYDSIAPMDSVIVWGQQAYPVLEEENQIELYFRVRQLVVHLYSLCGYIGQAIDEARDMYEKAEKMKHGLGIALSSIAIGDAYYSSNMFEEAINSYKEAIRDPVTFSDNNYYKQTALFNLISLLMMEGRMQEVEVYRTMLLKLQITQKTNLSLQYFTSAMNVSYYILKNDLQKASENFSEVEEIYQSNRQPYFTQTYLTAKGKYNEAIGNYQLALQCYDDILMNVRRKIRSIVYLRISYDKAALLIKMGRSQYAASIYEEISIITDSIVAPCYAHSMNNLRASYQENRIKVGNKAESNRLFMSCILVGLLVMCIIIYLVLYIRKRNREMSESKIRLEQSKLKLENAIQMKSLFLSNMSHEIRTPLSAISGFSNILTDKGLDEATRRQCNEVIQQNSELLIKLINDVIDLSDLAIGKMKFKFDYYDPISICQYVVETVNKVKQTQAEVLFESSLDSLKLYTDDSRLQQLLINLLINATKFTPSGSIILELSKQSETTVLFSVTDTGCGIPLEKQSKIFNRFEKLDEGVQGTGLGLSICQFIVQRMGGEIWIDSEYTAGCRFCFTHPINLIIGTKEGEGA